MISFKPVCAAALLAVFVAPALAEEMDLPADSLAAHECSVRNGTYDEATKRCTLPSEDSASADPLIGPMLQVLQPGAQSEEDGQEAAQQ